MMKKGVNMDSLNTGSVLSVPPLPVLSTSKLGCPYSSSTLLSRRLESKAIMRNFQCLLPQQQKMFVKVIIDRCKGPDLAQLNNALEPLLHRDFQAHLNQSYPADGLKSKINFKKAQVKIHKTFDKIFMVKMNWQQAGKRNRRRRQRKAYLNEKLYPSTPLYPSKDMRLFTLHVQKAVAKILESQGFPVKASDEAAREADGIKAKKGRLNVNEPEGFSSPKPTYSYRYRRSSLKYARSRVASRETKPTVNREDFLSPGSSSTDIQVGQFSKPPSQHELLLDDDEASIEIARSALTHPLMILVEESVEKPVPIEEAAVVPAESVSLPTASIHDLPINNPLPSSEVPVYEPHHTHSYHLNHPTVLRSFRPEPDGVLNHQPSATSLRNSGLHSASTPALTTRLRQKQNVSLPQLSSLVEKHPNSHTFQSHSNKSFKTKSKVAPKVVETAPSDAAISSTVDERRDFKLAGALKKESVTNLLVDSMTDEGSAVFDRLDFTAHTSDATVFGSATTMSSARFDGNVSTLTTDNTTINTAAATMGTSIDTAASTVTSTVTSTRSSTLASLDTNNILPSSVLQHKSNLVKFQDVSPKGTGATKMSPSSSSHSMHRKSRNKITSKKTPVYSLPVVGLLCESKKVTYVEESCSRFSRETTNTLSTKDRLRIATASTIDICETELPCFGPHEVTPSVRSEELQVIEPEYSNEQLVEDNSMVTEFSNSLYKSLSKSRDLIDDEDDLADEIAECILASSIGLALVSSSPRSNLSAGRLLNLKDRLSSEALQATLKVFRIKPPTGAVKEEEKVERDVVPPFALTKDSLMPKVSYPHTYFSKKKLANSQNKANFKKSSVSLKTKARTMKKVVLDIPQVPNTDIVRPDAKSKRELLSGKLAGKGLSVKNDAADSDFLQQLDYLNQVTKSWSSAELVNLLIQLIEASYATSSESILPMIKADIGVKVAHVQNIYELPDFVLLKMFSYLDVGSLRNCQEVCRRWRFLCSQPIIWKDKCQKLGNKYNMHNLCASIAKELDGKHLDWQTIYLELENRLRRLYDPPVVNLHPAVMAKKVGAEPLAAVPCQPLIMLASDPPQEVSDGSVDTPTSTLNVSNSTSSPHSETESMIGAHPVSLAAKSKKVFHKSKFPHLKLSNQELVWVTDSPVKGGQDDSKEQKADVRLKVSAKLKNSADSDTQKDSTLPAQQLPSRNDSLTASEDRKGDKSQPGVALDLRTNLQPAVQLDKTSLDLENVLCTNGVARSCNQVVNSSTLAKSSHASQPFLEWLPLSEYNPTDISTRRRIVGFVKPVSYVHKFKGHLDEIYCCAFDKNRVFTGGVDAHIFLWDIRTGRYVQKLDYHTGSIRSLELDSEDDILYSASWDTTVVIWDAIKFEVKACLTGHSAAVVEIKLCKAKHIICSASTDGTVRTWCTDTYSNIQVLRDHVANINCVYYDGMDIASGGADRAVHVYSHCRDQPETKYAYKGHCSAGHTLKSTISIGRIALSTAQSWNKTDQNKYSANSVTSILVINDLIVGGTSHGEIICWSKIALTVVARFDLHMGSITSINLWCSRLLTCGSDGVIKETDLATMTCVRQLNDHFTSIHCMKVNERLERIVSVGEDKLVHVWHFAKNKKRSKSESEGTVRCLALPSPVFKVDLQGETKTSRVKQRPPK